MKKRSFMGFIFGLCLSVLLVFPVYAQDSIGSASGTSDGSGIELLDEQKLKQEQENMMQNLPFAFGEFPSFTVSNVDAWSFESLAENGSGVLGNSHYNSKLGRSRVAGSGMWSTQFLGPIENIPTGALVFGMQIEACDGNASDDIWVSFEGCPSPSGFCSTIGYISTGTSATPGCDYFSLVIDPPVQIFNVFATYIFHLWDSDLSETTSFRNARLFWARVQSPAPGTASFDDVGTGAWYFQGVEALAAAGITKGCNPPTNNLFCPNSAVTRAQMAVFLARALGLHWPG
jgi:hypothetical protein